MSTNQQSKQQSKKVARKSVNIPGLSYLKEELAKSRRFWLGCSKPSKAEYQKLLVATAIGIIAIGATGFVVKVVSYPVFRTLGNAGADAAKQ